MKRLIDFGEVAFDPDQVESFRVGYGGHIEVSLVGVQRMISVSKESAEKFLNCVGFRLKEQSPILEKKA